MLSDDFLIVECQRTGCYAMWVVTASGIPPNQGVCGHHEADFRLRHYTADQPERDFYYQDKDQDYLGAWEGDLKFLRSKPGCGCRYCKFFRGEIGGKRLVMCERDWEALPAETRATIAESVND